MPLMRSSHAFFIGIRKNQVRKFAAAKIFTKDVNVLREQAGARTMECKKAYSSSPLSRLRQNFSIHNVEIQIPLFPSCNSYLCRRIYTKNYCLHNMKHFVSTTSRITANHNNSNNNCNERKVHEFTWTAEERDFFKLSKQRQYTLLNQKFDEYKISKSVTVTMYNIMIGSIKKMKRSKTKDLKKLGDLVSEMEELHHVEKNLDTYNNIINLLGHYKQIDLIEKYLDEMKSNNIPWNRYTYNMLINIYGNCKKFDVVKSIYNEMVHHSDHDMHDNDDKNKQQETRCCSIKPDSYTYNTLINVFGKHKQIADVDYFVDEMQNNGIEPNYYTYNILISIYGKDKDFYMVNKILRRMKRIGIKPGVSTYMALVVAYTRAGLFDDCEEHVEKLERLVLKNKNYYVKTALEKYYKEKALIVENLEKQEGGREKK
jgi:pentatricopeptide repeat protein